jgi:hypothetical protein
MPKPKNVQAATAKPVTILYLDDLNLMAGLLPRAAASFPAAFFPPSFRCDPLERPVHFGPSYQAPDWRRDTTLYECTDKEAGVSNALESAVS